MDMNNNKKLTICDKEKIHLIANIQNSGYLFIFAKDANERDKLEYVSENIVELLNLELQHIFNKNELNKLLNCTENELVFIGIFKNKTAQFTLDIRNNLKTVTVELFEEDSNKINEFNHIINLLISINNKDNLLQKTAEYISKITNYDRIMVYMFDADYNGEVVYELINKKGIIPYYGLKFPSSDIPVQARLLYLSNKVRVINNIDKDIVKIIGRNGIANILDLTGCPLRASSLIHIEYMKNMGIKGSVSIAVTSNESKLIGLLVLHDYSGNEINPCVREFCKTLSSIISYKIDDYEKSKKLEKITNIEKIIIEISILLKSNIVIPINKIDNLKKIFESDVFIHIYKSKIYQGTINKISEKLINKLVDIINKNEKNILSTNNLTETGFNISEFDTEYHNEIEYKKQNLSGIIGIKYKHGYIIIGRSNITSEIKWAGDPDYKREDSITKKLHPRNSFEIFVKNNKYKCKNWENYEINAFENLISNIENEYYKVIEEKELINKNNDCKNNILDISTTIEMLAHEIKVPFNGIIGALNMFDTINYNEIPKYIEITKRCAKVMGFVIENTLTISGLLNNNLTINKKEKVNIEEICDDCVFILDSSIKNKNINITINYNYNSNSIIISDNQKLRQIITNIISNSVKYTNENKKVDININILSDTNELLNNLKKLKDKYQCIYPKISEDKNIMLLNSKEKYLICTVTDEGIGIKHEDYNKLFKVFSRINNYNVVEGSGLGLRITSLLCNSLNGEIYCGSTYNIGSSFVFYIKITEESNEIVEVSFKKNVILVVEDDIISIIVLKKMIKTIDSSIIVESVNNIKDGLTIIKEQYSSILMLLTDININDKNGGGIELAQQIRKFEENNNLKNSINIIAMTANSSNSVHEDCINAGINNVIYKPIYLKNIKDCIMKQCTM